MSYILKALKKLEVENAARNTAAVQIKSAILTPHGNSHALPRKSSGWMIIALVFFAGGIMTYFILSHVNPVTVQRQENNIQPEQSTQTIPPAQLGLQSRKSKIDVEAVSPAANIPDERTLSRQIIQEKTTEATAENTPIHRSTTEHAALPGAATSSLTVNGIAIQDDPSESIAVVNGVIVKQGMTIGGAKVERIFLNRVRFKDDSGTFEVHLAK
jgi:hypothetical protein